MLDVDIDVNEFNDEMQKALDKYENEILLDILKEISLGFLEQVIPLTPVDTGQARAGWYPALQGLGGTAPGKNNGEGDIKITKNEITIRNRVKHIIYLEYGHSKQAPKGMVRVTLRKMKKVIKAKYG